MIGPRLQPLAMKTLVTLLAIVPALIFAVGCATDPDLDPEPNMPESASTPLPWNRPVPGQGGGAFGAMPNQQFRR